MASTASSFPHKHVGLVQLHRGLKPFEAIYLKDSDCPHAISWLYNILLSGSFPSHSFYTRDWEKELECPIPDKAVIRPLISTLNLV